MIKECVKKPFTVLVAVIVCLTLAAVSLTEMSTDLLPEMSMPYMIVITTYPGASPEKVETSVSKPLEGSLGTVSRVKSVTSTSAENYSMVMLEFEDDTNMDSAMVKVNSSIQGTPLPDECGTPNVMEISVDMMATEYLAFDMEGKDIYELSDFVEENIIPYYERQDGVSNVTDLGLVNQSVEVRLDEKKIDKVNDKILAQVDEKMADAKKEIEDAQADLDEAKDKMEDGKSELTDKQEDTANQLGEASLGMNTALATQAAYQAELASQQANLMALQMELKAYEDAGIEGSYEQLNGMFQTLKASVGGQETHDAIYQQVYQQILIAAVQQMVDAQSSIEDSMSGILPSIPGIGDGSGTTPGLPNIPGISDGGNTPTQPDLPSGGGDSDNNDNDAPSEEENDSDEEEDDSDEGAPQTQSADPILFEQGALIVDGQPIHAQAEKLVARPNNGIYATELANTARAKVVVTAENVEEILDGFGEQVADGVRATCAQAAEQATQEQMQKMVEQYPDSIEDALKNPEKLDSAIELMKTMGQGEAAAMLSADNLRQLDGIVNTRIPNIHSELQNLQIRIATAQAVVDQVNSAVGEAIASYSSVEAGKILAAAGFGSADAQLAAAQSAVESGQAQLDSALESFEEAKKTALKNANINALMDAATLSQVIYAQNFAMPAGYIDDKDDNQWMLKIGEGFHTLEELQDMLLAHIDGVGNIRLKDVADITIIDNAGDSFTKVNGNQAVVLAIYKASTSGTSEVSRACNKASDELMEKYPGLTVSVLMDQGEYISLFISNILKSMVIGAILAVFVLAVFLKDVLPTLVVAFSIPFSLLVSLLLMYFTDISLNMMSLSGLSLAIGMLVDNSIVVIENIYRLRGRGLTAPRAAVQGGRQVEGAIIASTLTTVCVFLPLIFTSGLTRQLMLPFALTIGFSLLASLVVALTVVPTISSVLLRNTREKKHPWFDLLIELYGDFLGFCLRVKIVPLALALVLLAGSIVGVVRMGVVLIPDMASDQISVSVNLPEDITKEDSYAKADEVMDQVLTVEGVKMVGAMSNAGSLIGGSAMSSQSYDHYTFQVRPTDDIDTEKGVNDLCDQLQEAVSAVEGAEVTVSASAMGSMSSMLGSGLSINIYGDDLDQLMSISKDLTEIIQTVEGFGEVTNGQEDADQTLHLKINRDKAMKLGLTTAQIYAQIAKHMTTETTSVKVELDSVEMNVTIVDETHLPTRETLLNEVFETTVTNDEGKQETEEHKLKEFGKLETADGLNTIRRSNNVRYMTLSAETLEGYNTTKLAEQLKEPLEAYEMPDGYSYRISGEYENVSDMMVQMGKMIALGFLFIYLVMVAQFQSLLSPFIVIFTVPLAFTGGFLGLLFGHEQLSLMAMMGFAVLMGTVVNNGIVFVDYTNQLRIGGMQKRPALIATGKTRMRPILMTAMTTILSMSALIFDRSTSAGMSRGMAIVVAGGLLYATLMTLFIVPVMYDILYRKQPTVVDVGTDEELDEVPDDAAEFIAQQLGNS